MSDNTHYWSYEGECGPQTWNGENSHKDELYGKHQSPINIETEKTVYNPNLLKKPLKITYDINACSQIKNTGYTFQVDGHPKNKTKVSGGPLGSIGKANFLQFHMHWGDDLERGSEHLIDGKSYSAEIHFVNWNHFNYKDPKKASESTKNDGLLVLAVFVMIGKHNLEFEKLAKCMHEIHLKDFQTQVDHINIKNLLPKYWTYPGSLTTPPYNECVQWVVFKNPIEISANQLEKCHELYYVSKEKYCNEKTHIRYNDRPVCSLNDRIVEKSFQ